MRIYNLLIFLIAGCSCSQLPKQIDNQNAVEAKDLSALISGCGQQISVGYLVCRIPEGNAANEDIEFHAPPNIQCDDETKDCVFFRIYFPDGRPTFEGSIKRGESFSKVRWSEVINKPTFDLGDRGFYAVSITIHYKGADGIERKTYADGYLLLHVVKKDYISLLENEEDEYFVWQWIAPTNQIIKMTTGSRVFLSPPNRNELRSTQKL